MKKIISVILSAVIVITALFCFGLANVSAASGNCGATGSSVTWNYDSSTKVLSLTGTGVVKDYGNTSLNRVPWYSYKNEITTVEVGEGITELGTLVFYNLTAVTSVSLPSTLTTIAGGVLADGYGAFVGCTSLESITLPQSLTTIEAMAFRGCTALKSITIPDSVTTLGASAFRECTSLETVTYGTGLTATGEYAFYDSGIKNINFSSTITEVSVWSFFNTKLTSVEIPENVTSIGTRAFANCSFIMTATVYNANCTFNGIIGEDPFNGSNQSLTMRGHSGSTTQTYATEKGYTFESIDDCDHATTHQEVLTPATCTVIGRGANVCDECGFSVSEYDIPATGHTYELLSENDQSATDGHIYREYSCIAGDDTKSEIEHVSYLDGFYTYTSTATCTRGGIETYTCTVEGCGKVTRNTVSAGQHQVAEYTQTLAPTCTTEGSEQGVCSVCGGVDTRTIPALGHTNTLVEERDDTAVDGHKYEIYHCSVCDQDNTVVTHTDWVDGKYTRTVVTEPKCVINGVARDTCSICAQTRNVTLPANGQHDWYETGSKAPTCTAQGEVYYACSNCSLTKTEKTQANGHSYKLDETAIVSPTCTETGSNKYDCLVCGATKSEVVPATGHAADQSSYTIVQNATCEENGLATANCVTCGAQGYEIVIAALGHDYQNVIEPIADKPGHSLSTPTCSRCGAKDTASTVHDEWIEGGYETTVVTEGSCTIARVTRDTCTYCNITRTNNTPAPGHSYVMTSYDATGRLSYECSVCANKITRTPATVLALWNVQNVNKAPSEVSQGRLLNVVVDDVINAKDYSLLLRLKKINEAQ